MKLCARVAAALALLAASTADAALIVSADSNIFGSPDHLFSTMTANQHFLDNIAGSNVLIQGSTLFSLTTQAQDVSTYLTGKGTANALLGSSATISAGDLAGRSLFIGMAPADAYTSGEIATLAAFMQAGGSVLFTAENSAYSNTANTYIRDALTALGSSIGIVDAAVDAGSYFTANISTANAITAGTTGFEYNSPSILYGGTTLYRLHNSAMGNGAIVAFEGALPTPSSSTVPELGIWAMLVGGFGLTGAMLRRQKPITKTA